VRCFAAKRVCGRAECAARSASMTARYLPPQTSPTTGTMSSRASLSSRRFFYFINKSSHRLASPLLLSAKGHARIFCSLVNAFATKIYRYQPFAGKSVINTRTKNQATPCGWLFCVRLTEGTRPCAPSLTAYPTPRCGGRILKCHQSFFP
jgi:hypothetical protein